MFAQRKKQNGREWRQIVLAFALVLGCGGLLFGVFGSGAARLVRNFFYPYLTLPAGGVYAVADETLLLRGKRELAAACREMSDRNAELSRQLLGLPPRSRFHYVAAEVVGRDPLNWQNVLQINRGERDGVRPGQAVLG